MKLTLKIVAIFAALVSIVSATLLVCIYIDEFIRKLLRNPIVGKIKQTLHLWLRPAAE